MKTFNLDNHPKIESGFLTPEHYFEDLSSKIMQQIQQKKTKTKSLFGTKKRQFYAIAAILVLALSIPLYLKFQTKESAIDNTAIENYLSYQGNISDDDLVDLMNEDDIEQLNFDLNIESITIENELSTNNNLEYYLIN